MVSMPDVDRDPEYSSCRRAIIMNTYLTARKNGDKKVWFVDGGSILNIFGGDNGTVDGTHPNDLGFYLMAKGIEKVLKPLLK